MRTSFKLVAPIILLFLSTLLLVRAESLLQNNYIPRPPANSWVSSPDPIVSRATLEKIDARIEQMRQTHKYELAVVLLKRINKSYFSLASSAVEQLAREVFDSWGVGDKDLNNGVLFMISIEDRVNRIQTGAGSKEALTDDEASSILSAKSLLKKQRYDDAIYQIVDEICSTLEGKFNFKRYIKDLIGKALIIFFVAVVIVVIISAIKTSRRQNEFEEKIKKLQDMNTKQQLEKLGSEVCCVCLEELVTDKKHDHEDKKHEDMADASSSSQSSSSQEPPSKVNDKIPVTLPCKHSFHGGCLRDWLSRKNECPLCRQQNPLKVENAGTTQQPSTSNPVLTHLHMRPMFTPVQYMERQTYVLSTMYSDVSSSYSINSMTGAFTRIRTSTSSSRSFGGGSSRGGGGSTSSW